MKKKIILPILGLTTACSFALPVIASCSCAQKEHILLDEDSSVFKANESNEAKLVFTLDKSDYSADEFTILTDSQYLDTETDTETKLEKIKATDIKVEGKKLTVTIRIYSTSAILSYYDFYLKITSKSWTEKIENIKIENNKIDDSTKFYYQYEKLNNIFTQNYSDTSKRYNKVTIGTDSKYGDKKISSASIAYTTTVVVTTEYNVAEVKMKTKDASIADIIQYVGGISTQSKIVKYNAMKSKFQDSHFEYRIWNDGCEILLVLSTSSVVFKEVYNSEGYLTEFYQDLQDSTYPIQNYVWSYSKE